MPRSSLLPRGAGAVSPGAGRERQNGLNEGRKERKADKKYQERSERGARKARGAEQVVTKMRHQGRPAAGVAGRYRTEQRAVNTSRQNDRRVVLATRCSVRSPRSGPVARLCGLRGLCVRFVSRFRGLRGVQGLGG